MKKFLLLSTLFALAALSQAGELLSPEQWKHECRPERKLSTVKIAGDGTVRFRRFAGAEFARLYQDVELERGAYYSLTYAQRTEHGALDKLLVIFRGDDGKWRDKSRLTDVTPLVNGEWTAGKLVFQVPPDVNLARIDFRLDSAGTVELKDIMTVCKEDALKEASESKELYQTAEENLQSAIEALLSPILKNAGYTMQWDV